MKSFFGTLYRQPDAPGGAAATPDPAAVADAAAVAAAAAAAQGETPAAEPDPAAPPAPVKKPWYLDRISEESGKRQSAEERAAVAERRAQEAEAVAARLAAGKEPPAAPTGERAAIQPEAVRAEAEKLRFYEDTVDVKNRGLSEYGAAFTDTLAVLNAVGAASNDFVADVMAVNKADAHKLFKQIADNPEKAVMLASMTSRQRIAELTRMTIAAPKPADPIVPAAPAAAVPAARVSRAPEPAPRIDPNASKVVDGYSDEASDEEFTKKFNERMEKRSGRR